MGIIIISLIGKTMACELKLLAGHQYEMQMNYLKALFKVMDENSIAFGAKLADYLFLRCSGMDPAMLEELYSLIPDVYTAFINYVNDEGARNLLWMFRETNEKCYSEIKRQLLETHGSVLEETVRRIEECRSWA